MTKTIRALSLNVRSPDALAEFYVDVLGMHREGSASDEVTLGYDGGDASLVLRKCSAATPYMPDKSDRYWKIALTLPDLDTAFEQLQRRGVAATEPRQFREIARMTHLADPDGHVIELIQHTFEGKPKTAEGNPDLPLGGGARVGLITLRTDDIDAEMAVCGDTLGMRYLSRQAVTDLGFDLYFFAPTGERQPIPDVNAVANREWLWQRPYTVLEFQHRLHDKIRHRSMGECGHATTMVEHGAESFQIT